jgi:hypothetical protein
MNDVFHAGAQSVAFGHTSITSGSRAMVSTWPTSSVLGLVNHGP